MVVFQKELEVDNGRMEIYRGRQGRVAMTITTYSTMTSFEIPYPCYLNSYQGSTERPDNPARETFTVSSAPGTLASAGKIRQFGVYLPT